MKKKLAIVGNHGFVGLYLNYLIEYCEELGITLNVIDKDANIKELLSEYDYVLVDCVTEKFDCGVCGILHSHSVIHKVRITKNFLHRLITFLTHMDKIKKTKQLYKSMPKIVAVSDILKQDLCINYGISDGNIPVAYPGFVIKKSSKREHFIKSNKEFIIGANCMGFISKGGYVILDALRYLRKNYPELKVKARLIYPKYKSNLGVRFYVWFYRLHNYVEFLGRQENMADFYNRCNVFVSPSLVEAFGRVVTEAMYCECPVIIGSNVGAADIIRDNVNGFVFNAEKNSAKNLAEKIKEVYDKYETLEEIVKNARNTAENMTWENFAKGLIAGLY